MAEKLRVLLVDYDAITRAGIKAVLSEGSLAEVVGVAAGVEDTPSQLAALTPDVVITNVQNKNGVDAAEVARIVKQVSSDIPVIVLTEDERDPYAINAVQAGISAYILRKNVTTEALESVIETVLRTGATVLNASLMKTVISSLTKNSNVALSHSVEADITDLTARELEVLRLMANGAINGEIGRTLGISHETVRKHVTRVVEKLGARNRTHAVIVGFHAGLSGATGPNNQEAVVQDAEARGRDHLLVPAD
jgi:DNA-binding NarL/FixJ family response regulator